MANTYTQLYIHIVFSVRNRTHLIKPEFKEALHKYITGIIQNKKNKVLAINSVSDHIHMFIGLNPDISISDLVKEIKRCSSLFINEKKIVIGKFYWQEGYGAFSHSHSQIDNVVKYIHNQEMHHTTKTFKEEYLEILNKFNIDYELKYVFDDD